MLPSPSGEGGGGGEDRDVSCAVPRKAIGGVRAEWSAIDWMGGELPLFLVAPVGLPYL